MQTKGEASMEFDVTEWKNNMDRDYRKTRMNIDRDSSRKSDSKLPNYFSFGSGVARTFRQGDRKGHAKRGTAEVVSYPQNNSNGNRNNDISMKDMEEALNIK